MRVQINTKIGKQKTNNAIANLNAQMKNIQIKLAANKSLISLKMKSSSYKFSQTLDKKVKQMDLEKENLGLTKNKLASVESRLKSIQNEFKQIMPEIKRDSKSSKEISEIAKAIKVIGSEIDPNFRVNNSTADNDSVETDLEKAFSNISKLEEKLFSKDMFLTSAIANSRASISRLIFTEHAMNKLNNNLVE